MDSKTRRQIMTLGINVRVVYGEFAGRSGFVTHYSEWLDWVTLSEHKTSCRMVVCPAQVEIAEEAK